MRKWALIFVFVLLFSSQPAVFAEQAPGGVNGLTKPDYKQFLIDRYTELTQSMNDSTLSDRAQSDPRRLTGMAEYALSLYEATGEQLYLDHAKKVWDILLDKWKTNTEEGKSINLPNGFFINSGLLHVYDILNQHGLVDASDVPYVLKVIRVNNFYQKGDDNQAFYRAIGMLYSIRLFPEEVDAKLWQQYADETWNYWYNQRDITENASHYSSISLNAAIKMAQITGRIDLMKTPEIRKIFERYRDQLSPSGAMPEYGDDYFGEAIEWIIVFEHAARLFNDPTYLDAAWKVFGFLDHNFRMEQTGNFDTDLWSLYNYSSLTGLLNLEPIDAEPVVTPNRSRVLTRNEPGTVDAIDKMILAPSRAPGSPFVMSELFGRGFHAHLNRVGAIQYYETGGKPHYHGMARHNKGATHSNVVAMMPAEASDNYPFGNKTFQPDVWYHESIPARMLVTLDTENDVVKFDPLNLRIQSDANIDFIIDNLRVEGPAGTLMIDSFEDLDKWVRSDNPYALTEDRTEGNHALNIHVKPGADIFYTAYGWEYGSDPNAIKPGYDLSFDLNQYDVIKYDWKYKAPNPVGFNYIFRMIVGTNTGIDTLAGDMNNVPTVSQVRTEDSRYDSYGQYKLDRYFTYDTSLTRRMVLTKEGFLVVQDRLEPGASASGQVAGPVWQTYSPGDQGPNWFNTSSENIEWKLPDGTTGAQPDLLIYMDQDAGRTFGINKNIEVSNNPTPAQTVFAKQIVEPGTPVTFVSILVPHDKDVDASGIAESIRISTSSDGQSTVSLSVPGAEMEEIAITIGQDSWTVKRSGDLNVDGLITMDDLDLANSHYMKNIHSSDWEQINSADINRDGVVDVTDFAFISSKIKLSENSKVTGDENE